jgi:hypothetical protein
MDPRAFHRKLAAILSADVAGYSRLMQDDEAATVATVKAYKLIWTSSGSTTAGWSILPETTSWPSPPAWWMRCSARWRSKRSCPRAAAYCSGSD